MAANSLQRRISSYIYQQAPKYGVNPNTALGTAWREGLNNPTASLSGNKDASGWSVGPFQLFAKPGGGGGLAEGFTKQFGAPDASNWQQQVDYSLGIMGKGGYGNWYAIRDAGGMGAITNIGAQKAAELGLGGSGVSIKDVTGTKLLGDGGTSPSPALSQDQLLKAGADPSGVGGTQALPPGGVTNGQTPANAFGVLSGIWEAMGVTAVSTAGKATAEATVKSGETIAKSTTDSAKTISEQQKASSVAETKTATDVANTWMGNVFNLFQRGGVMLLALLLVGLGLWLMGSSTIASAKSKLVDAVA